MQYHQLTRIHPHKRSISVGRGGKRGKTSGRGTKGQKARAGRKMRPEMRDIIMKIPKLRGYAFKSFRAQAVPVKLSDIVKAFDSGADVNPKTLAEKNIIETSAGVLPRVKILAGGDIAKKIVVSGCAVSAGAKAAIEKAGGSIALTEAVLKRQSEIKKNAARKAAAEAKAKAAPKAAAKPEKKAAPAKKAPKAPKAPKVAK